MRGNIQLGATMNLCLKKEKNGTPMKQQFRRISFGIL